MLVCNNGVINAARLPTSRGLDRTYIGRCENGKQNATLKTIYSLAEVLGVEATELLPPMSEVIRKP